MSSIHARLKALPVGETLHLKQMGKTAPLLKAVRGYRRKYGGVWNVRSQSSLVTGLAEVWATRVEPDYEAGRSLWPFKDMKVGDVVTLPNVPTVRAVNALHQIKHRLGWVFEYRELRISSWRFTLHVKRVA